MNKYKVGPRPYSVSASVPASMSKQFTHNKRVVLKALSNERHRAVDTAANEQISWFVNLAMY